MPVRPVFENVLHFARVDKVAQQQKKKRKKLKETWRFEPESLTHLCPADKKSAEVEGEMFV